MIFNARERRKHEMANDNIVVPAGEHEQKRTLTIVRFIPDHPDRKGTPVFEHTRKELIANNPDARCEINNEDCDHDHPLELHHDHVEWCDTGDADWEKVKKDVPDFDWASFDQTKPETFVDSKWNAKRVLCKKHHTGEDHGIHCLDYPTWQAQKYKRDGFIMTPDEEAK